MSTGEKLKEGTLGFEVRQLDIHPDGEWLVAVGSSADIGLWQWQTDDNRTIATATAEEVGEQSPLIRAVSFNPDGTQIFVGGIGGISNDMKAFDTTSGELLHTYTGHTGVIYSIDLSYDGTSIVSSSEDDNIIIWRSGQPEPLRSLYGHTDDVAAVMFSPDARFLLSGSYDNTARLWDVNSGNELQRFDINAAVLSVAFDAQGRTLLTGDRVGDLQHWDIRDLPKLLEWVDANRYVPLLTCEQKVLYQISNDVCNS
ncbi:hypothetical protein HC776_03695 [bacterium]|nr:hypothetical protein [bacterium]